MKKPDIENMREMAIRVLYKDGGDHIKILQTEVIPTISVLKEKCGVKWYCFLIHNRDNGVPIPYNGPQFHIRFENSANHSQKELSNLLPDYCEMIRKVESKDVEKISGIDTTLLNEGDIREAWRIIGESCEWIVGMINAHKLEFDIPPQKMAKQISQFLHYLANITQLQDW
jgi:hypothetical protein